VCVCVCLCVGVYLLVRLINFKLKVLNAWTHLILHLSRAVASVKINANWRRWKREEKTTTKTWQRSPTAKHSRFIGIPMRRFVISDLSRSRMSAHDIRSESGPSRIGARNANGRLVIGMCPCQDRNGPYERSLLGPEYLLENRNIITHCHRPPEKKKTNRKRRPSQTPSILLIETTDLSRGATIASVAQLNRSSSWRVRPRPVLVEP